MSPALRTQLRSSLESLEDRRVPAVVASFNTDSLVVIGNNAANDIVVSADESGTVRVFNNGQEVAINASFGSATRGSLKSIVVDAKGGDDTVTLDRSLNSLDAQGNLAAAPNATLLGGNGNDTLTPLIGGFLGGVIGAPIVGNVVMDGGNGNDFLDSGFGNDLMFGGNGDDTLRWLPGTLIDTFEGGNGNDTAIVVGNGRDQGDAFVLSAGNLPGRVLFQRTNLVPFFIDIGTTENVVMQTQSGDDSITVNDLTGTSVRRVTADGGVGNDTITGVDQQARRVVMTLLGGDGDDVLIGGAGNDLVDGGAGNDFVAGGSGLDVLLGGDGDDTLDDGGVDRKQDILVGGAGADTFVRYKVGRAGAAFDEFVVDFTPGEGDVMS